MAVKHLTAANFDGEIEKAPVALVDFWAPWCGPCRMMGPVIEALGEKYEGRALIAKVDTDQAQELAVRFQVENIPTLVFFKNGKEAARQMGTQAPERLAAVLDKLLQN